MAAFPLALTIIYWNLFAKLILATCQDCRFTKPENVNYNL